MNAHADPGRSALALLLLVAWAALIVYASWFPFTGWNGSFFGDLHVQGQEGVQFYTRQKVTLSRWFAPSGGDAQDPVWNSARPKRP